MGLIVLYLRRGSDRWWGEGFVGGFKRYGEEETDESFE